MELNVSSNDSDENYEKIRRQLSMQSETVLWLLTNELLPNFSKVPIEHGHILKRN